jgi:NitT/TauT family transport system substrate-binding protein
MARILLRKLRAAPRVMPRLRERRCPQLQQWSRLMPDSSRRAFASIILGAAVLLSQGAAAQDKKTLLVAEPGHGVASLPFYVAMAKGFFVEEGLDVQILTTDGGGAHTNAVLSGQAFAFIGGPEHNAFAKLKGADLRGVVNLNDRATAYFVAKKGLGPAAGQSMADYMKGKSIAVSLYGGTPNSILRNLLGKWRLNPRTDVTLHEMAASGILPAVNFGHATVGVAPEPFVTRGVRGGVWDEPFINIPKELGPYVYTTLNIRLSSIKDEPDTVRKFVKGVLRGLSYTHAEANREEIALIAKKEFPTMPPEDLKGTIERSFADEAWSFDGTVSHQSWDTATKIVLEAGILKKHVPFDDVFDMQFVKGLKAASTR